MLRSFVGSLLGILLIAASVQAQITIPDVIPPHEPIVAGCNCTVPKGATVLFMWRTDAASRSILSEKGDQIYVWAPPGEHFVEAIVIVQTFKTLKVLVPDPDDPNKPPKTETLKIQDTIDVQRYDKTYRVSGTVPPGPNPPGPNPPGPNPPPTPTPILPPLGKVAYEGAIKVEATARAKATELAANHESVAARLAAGGFSGADEQAQLEAAGAELTKLNRATCSAPGVRDAWLPTFTSLKEALDKEGTATKEQYITAWNDIAKGLRAVQVQAAAQALLNGTSFRSK